MTDSDDSSQTDRTTLDQLLIQLSNPTRRSILLTLAEANPCDADEFRIPEFKTHDEDFELFAAEVMYDHLPQLARSGFIEWDRDSETITEGPNFEDVRPLLTLIQNHQDELPDDWHQPDD